MTIQLTFDTEGKANAAEATICSNCGFPDENGTDCWAVVKKAAGENLWYFPKPPENGSHGFTCDEIMNGVVDYTESEYDRSWEPSL